MSFFAARIVVVGVIGAFAACASPPPHDSRSPASSLMGSGDGGASSSSSRHVESVPSLDLLAARGPTDAPQMREVLRVADANAKTTSAIALDADGCIRAIVASSAPVRAWIEDDTHAARGEVAASASASTSLVPPRGPACARKGETLHLVVEAGATNATSRAVVWQAP